MLDAEIAGKPAANTATKQSSSYQTKKDNGRQRWTMAGRGPVGASSAATAIVSTHGRRSTKGNASFTARPAKVAMNAPGKCVKEPGLIAPSNYKQAPVDPTGMHPKGNPDAKSHKSSSESVAIPAKQVHQLDQPAKPP